MIVWRHILTVTERHQPAEVVTVLVAAVGEEEKAELMNVADYLIEQGVQKGLREGLRQAVETACELLGVELTEPRLAHLKELDVAGLEVLLAKIRADRRWP